MIVLLIVLGSIFAIIVGVFLVCIIMSWIDFNHTNLYDNYVKLSHQEFQKLYKEYENQFDFDDKLFGPRLYLKMEQRYRIQLNIIDYLCLMFKAKQAHYEEKKKKRIAANKQLNKELALKEQIAWLTNPERIRKELDENGFTELNYTNKVMIDAKHVDAAWHSLKENDVICELQHKDLEVTHFELYVIVQANKGYGLKSIPIGEYAKLKKESADDN